MNRNRPRHDLAVFIRPVATAIRQLCKRLPLFAAGAAAVIVASGVSAAPPGTGPGTAFTYQGHLKQNSSPANGSFAMTFKLFDSVAGGAQQGSTLSVPAVSVSSGIFTVSLDFGVSPYAANQALWLEIVVSGTTLTPRQALTGTPFALNSRGLSVDAGGNVGIGATAPGKRLQIGDTTFNNSEGMIRLQSKSGTGPAYRSWDFGIPETDEDLSGAGYSFVIDDTLWGTEPEFTVHWGNGNVGIGTITPTSKLDVAGTAEMDGFKLNGNGAAAGKVLTSDANGVGTWQTAASGASQWTTSGSNVYYAAGKVGIGSNFFSIRPNALEVWGPTEINNAGTAAAQCGTPLSVYHCWGSPTTPIAIFRDASNSSQLQFKVPELTGRAELQAWNGQPNSAGVLSLNVAGGNVGVGTVTPTNKLSVSGSADFSGGVGIGTTSPAKKLQIGDSGTPNSEGMIRLQSRSGTGGASRTWDIGVPETDEVTTGTGYSFVIDDSGTNGIDFMVHYGDGNVGIGMGSSSPTALLQVGGGGIHDFANTTTLGVGMRDTDTAGLSIRSWNTPAYQHPSIQFSMKAAGPNPAVQSTIKMNGNGDLYVPTGNVGIGTSTPTTALDVAGTVRTHVLTITGGSDIAEPFNVHTDCPGFKVKPGMVVCIDRDRIGELRIANNAYDTTVAGIISGANGVNAGLTLTQEGGVADGKQAVAMTGRVWTWCDADAGGAIRAGDLLTSSDVEGHAMKASDRERAGGATLGKAMSSLERGRGLVLVLVNLQ